MNTDYPDMPDVVKVMLPTIFNSALEAILVVKKSGEILIANPGAHQMFGYDRGELLGLSVDQLLPEAFQAKHTQLRGTYYHHPRPRPMGVGLDLKGLRKDKSEFYLEVSLNHVVHKEEMLVVAFVVDVTARKQYEVKLQEYSTKLEDMVATRTKALEKQVAETKKAELQARQSEETYKLIARNFPSGTINVFDRDLNYIFVEGQVLFEMGITGEQLIGSKYTDRLAPEIAEVTQEQLQKVFNGKGTSFEIEFEGKFFNINAVPLLRDEDGVSQVLVVEENITKQKLAELEVQRALEQEQKLGQLKSKFVTLASHEFRTPLATISSSASLIAKYTNTEQQPKRDKHINRIQSSVKHLTNILNDFLSLGKLEEGQVQNTPVIFKISELCNELSEEMEGQLKDGQQIQHLHEGESEEVTLDKKLLKNCLIILLSNAMKYSDENQFIELKTEISSSEVKIAVKDNGIGIPKEDQAMLFSRFYRASNIGNIQGTGMGLNILKKYADLMRGKISFVSGNNEGTEFTLMFEKE